MTIGIAAAGTGGHVFPALAVAEALTELGAKAGEVVFFGGDRIEATAVPEAGFELVRVDLSGFARKASLHNLRVLGQVLAGARQVRREIKARNVTAMLGMGGYITGPAALAARWSRVPLFLHEQNAVPGTANRLAARLARRVFVAFPAAAAELPRTEVVGNPLRAAFHGVPPDVGAARSRYGLDESRPVVGILGGSQGADALNKATGGLMADSPSYQVLHLAGRDQHQQWTEQAAGRPGWVVVPFESEMPWFYAASDLVVARAGALTVSELAATGTPSILIPYPGAAGHQEANARLLVEAGGATLLSQDQIEGLPAEVAAGLEPAELVDRRTAAAAVGRPGAAGRIAAVMQEAADA